MDDYFRTIVLKDKRQNLQQLEGICKCVQNIKEEWTDEFKKSIQRWMNYINLRLQREAKGLQYQAQKKYLQETKKSVLKGLYNIEKLYMIPDGYSIKTCIKSVSKEKKRSISNQSLSNHRFSLFTPKNKPIRSTFNTITQQSTCFQNQKANKLTKSFFKKPSYQQPCISRSEETEVQKIYKQKQNQKIKQQISHQIHQKINQTQLLLNQKIDLILKQIEQKNKENIENKEIIKKLQNNSIEQKQKENFLNIKQNNPIKHDKAKSKIVFQQNKFQVNLNDIDTLEISEQPKLKYSSKHQTKLKQQQNNLQQFIKLCKKIKLPLNDSLLNIFAHFYSQNCEKVNRQAKREIINEIPSKQNIFKYSSSQFQKNLMNLKKLLEIPCKAQKKQKIQAFVKTTIQCTHQIILNDKYQQNGSLDSQLNQVLKKIQKMKE